MEEKIKHQQGSNVENRVGGGMKKFKGWKTE
jgi:hypothetical protein